MKKIIIILISLTALLLILVYGTQKWLENNLVTIINQNPDRGYDITFEKLDLDLMMGSFDLEGADITPRTEQGTLINGEVEEIRVSGISWSNLILGKNIDVSEIIFYKPAFIILLAPPHSMKVKPTRKVQQLFGDILSRGELRKFSITEGSLQIFDKADTLEDIGHVRDINIEATGLETDSLHWKYPLPFEMESFSSSLKDLKFSLDEHSILKCGSLQFRPDQSTLTLNDLSLKFNKDWLEVSESLGKQIDLFEIDLKSLKIRGIAALSQFVGDIDIRAESITLDSLVLKDHRDKNKTRPPDVEMPMFAKMVGSIPIGLQLDTIMIRNSFITYVELPEGKTEPGAVHFDQLYGSIYNITTHESAQSEYKQFEADLVSKLNGSGNMNIRLTVPYGARGFHLNASIDSLDVTSLNSTLVAMAGINVSSGLVTKMELDMQAKPTFAENKLIMDYYDLSLDVLKEGKKGMKRRGLVSDVANFAVRTKNNPGSKNYIIAEFRSERNIYRGPFNFMWKTVKDGFAQVIPTKTAKGLLGQGNSEKKTKK